MCIFLWVFLVWVFLVWVFSVWVFGLGCGWRSMMKPMRFLRHNPYHRSYTSTYVHPYSKPQAVDLQWMAAAGAAGRDPEDVAFWTDTQTRHAEVRSAGG